MYGNEHNVHIMGNIAMLRCKFRGGTHIVLMDTEDLPKLSRLKKPYITCHNNKPPYYLYAKDNDRRSISIARLVSRCPDDLVVVYRNNDSLDLRKKNLQHVTPLEQSTAASHKRHYGKEVHNA
ncbi:hypothetical protein EalM132_00025 [Exiguobacterium phage vB_EalM-132]|nr:hypothetical protein EalM132_00025 [Exiguobacterium phage vB_EalM-132]